MAQHAGNLILPVGRHPHDLTPLAKHPLKNGEKNANISQKGESGGGSNNDSGFSLFRGSTSNTACRSVPTVSSEPGDPPECPKKPQNFTLQVAHHVKIFEMAWISLETRFKEVLLIGCSEWRLPQ